MRGAGNFVLRPYSEFMPPPYAVIKPYEPDPTSQAATDGTARAFWHGMDAERLADFVHWAGVKGEWRILDDELPEVLVPHRLEAGASVAALSAIITFTPFSALPANIREAYLLRELTLLP